MRRNTSYYLQFIVWSFYNENALIGGIFFLAGSEACEFESECDRRASVNTR
jgi:hypothetical protein